MNERETFITALQKNEDDVATRLVYADWLDEHGEHEEADRQRKWPAAKTWLKEMHSIPWGHPDDETHYLSYEEMIETGREAILEEGVSERLYFGCGNDEDLCNKLRGNHEEFWKNWSIVTGIPLPEGIISRVWYGCAC